DGGAARTTRAGFRTRADDADDPRLQRRLGGGTLYDLGVTCIHAARALFGAEPAQVMAMTARSSRRHGGDVDEGTVALIRFPDERLAHFHTSFGEEPKAGLTIFGEEGSIALADPYETDAPMTLAITPQGERQKL